MIKLSRVIILLGLVLVVTVFSYAVWEKEQTLAKGEIVLIHLAPVDPRSLMQGDYMVLNYDIPRDIEEQADLEGLIVYSIDDQQVITFKRLAKAQEVLKAGEKLIHYRKRRRGIQVGSNSFFFQEGKASVFEKAKYGELRVDSNGKSILIALRDENREQLGLTSGLD